MTRKSSKKNKALHSPPFLNRANVFYGRLNEVGGHVQIEGESIEEQTRTLPEVENQTSQDNMATPGWIEEDDHANDFNQGMMDDDSTTLLKRKPSRLSYHWRSSRKTKSDKSLTGTESTETENKEVQPVAKIMSTTSIREPELVHFKTKTEDILNVESMEVVKRNTFKNYCKAVDRAFHRGWETFIINLYSVTLTPVSSTSSSSSPPSRN